MEGKARIKADKTKPISKLIKDLLPEDNELIHQISDQNKVTVARAVNIIFSAYRNSGQNESIVIPEEFQQKINSLTAQVDQLDQENKDLFNQNKELTLQLEEFINQQPAPSTGAKIELSGTQFICEPSEKLANQMKKVRRFLKSKGELEPSEAPETFANNLACLSIKKYLNNNYSHLI